MANECKRPAKPSGRKKQVAGTVLFWIGLVFLVIGIILCAMTLSSGDGELEQVGAMITGYASVIAWGISCLFWLIGVILYFVGRSQAKKAKN
ncbi:MAG: hypothetical protein WC455_04175 [Dehalococcoidia bacterium]|jgi:type IV secretory pathway VirB3-like protein